MSPIRQRDACQLTAAPVSGLAVGWREKLSFLVSKSTVQQNNTEFNRRALTLQTGSVASWQKRYRKIVSPVPILQPAHSSRD
jgi:hypothetical protein